MMSNLRGMDSTGLIVARRKHAHHGKFRYNLRRKLGNSLDFLKDKDVVSAFNLPNIYALIGHTRFATIGAVNEVNAHPIEEGKIIGVHNGVIPMLAPTDKHHPTETDSRAFFRIMDKEGFMAAHKAIQLSGSFAAIWIDKNNQSINLARNKQRPLFYMRGGEKNSTYFVASEFGMLLWIKDRYDNLEFTEVQPVPEMMWSEFKLDNWDAVQRPIAPNVAVSVPAFRQAQAAGPVKPVDIKALNEAHKWNNQYSAYHREVEKFQVEDGYPFPKEEHSIKRVAELFEDYCGDCQKEMQFCSCSHVIVPQQQKGVLIPEEGAGEKASIINTTQCQQCKCYTANPCKNVADCALFHRVPVSMISQNLRHLHKDIYKKNVPVPTVAPEQRRDLPGFVTRPVLRLPAPPKEDTKLAQDTEQKKNVGRVSERRIRQLREAQLKTKSYICYQRRAVDPTDEQLASHLAAGCAWCTGSNTIFDTVHWFTNEEFYCDKCYTNPHINHQLVDVNKTFKGRLTTALT